MTKDRSFIDQVAANAEQEPAVVSRVIEEFCLALRRELDEYKGVNGDYVGEQLHWDIGNRAFFHLLGFLDQFSEKYQWEPGSAREYVSRLFTEDEWKPFSQEYFSAKLPDDPPSAAPASGLLEEFSSAAYACTMSLMSNADYVQKELPTVELPTDIRASVEALCKDWIGTKHDVIHELDELQESSNIEDRVRRIMSWLGEDMVKLQEQVRRLEALATAEDRYRLAYLLVGESGGNILRSFVAAGESADRVLEGR
ncbi:MAG: hypothetical protein V4451_02530 [Pseudomonadota bacterium]